MGEHTVRVKRVYEAAVEQDGYRVLVDRLWPRGLSKVRAHLDEWLKEVAPSTELREWFGHQPERFAEFTRRYEAELDGNAGLEQLRQLNQRYEVVTLLYAARDEKHNEAVVLQEMLA